MARRGRFIVLEGIDGCGSTSQAERLAQVLRQRGYPVRSTCEPSTGPIGVLIRDILRHRTLAGAGQSRRSFSWATLGLLFTADRHDHVESLILPALREGAVVISDRYALSTVAYEAALAPHEAQATAWLRELNRWLPVPDVTIVLDVSAPEAQRRRTARSTPAELFETSLLQSRLADIYARAEQLLPLHRVVHVAGEGSLTQVGDRILATVEPIVAAVMTQPQQPGGGGDASP